MIGWHVRTVEIRLPEENSCDKLLTEEEEENEEEEEKERGGAGFDSFSKMKKDTQLNT